MLREKHNEVLSVPDIIYEEVWRKPDKNKDNKNRPYISSGPNQYVGSQELLACQSRCPCATPNRHTTEEPKRIAMYRCNLDLGIMVYRHGCEKEDRKACDV